MDRIVDTLFDPRVILALVAGWTLHELVTRKEPVQLPAGKASEMAGTIMHRQMDLAKKHAVQRAQSFADERTRAVVDSLFPSASRNEQKIIQLQVPK